MKLGVGPKILLTFVILISIPVILLGYLSYTMASNSLQKTIEDQLRETTMLTAEAIARELETAQDMLQVIANNDGLAEVILENGDEERNFLVHNYLRNMVQEYHELFESLILTDARGVGILNDSSPSSSIDYSDRDYVKQALQGVTAISDVITSRVTGNTVIAIGHPITSDGQVIGVLIGTINFSHISEHADAVTVGESGYAYMVNREGVLIAHPVKEKVLTENLSYSDSPELRQFVEQMKRGEAGEGFYTYEGVYKFVRFEPVAHWTVALTANYDEYMAAALDIRNRTLVLVIGALVIALGVAAVMTKNIVRPLKELQGLMEMAGKGDLTVHSMIRTGDEFEALGNSFNQMITSQAAIVEHVRQGAQELAAASQEMAASSEQVSSGSQQIAVSIQMVAQDADKQNEAVLNSTKALVQLASLVQLAQNRALKINESSEKTVQVAQEGRLRVQSTVETIKLINDKAEENMRAVRDLSQLSVKVGEIINTINAIAAQTNLLALNAAIEAARAGEHGRGFAVVADEVRKLAEQSNQGANEISALVMEMIAQTEQAVKSMEEGKAAAEKGVTVVGATDQTFAEIIQAVEDTVNNVKQIVDITKEEVATSDQVINLIDTVATITENTTSNSQKVAAAVEEQTSAIETVAASAEEVSALANSLDELVRKFKIE